MAVETPMLNGGPSRTGKSPKRKVADRNVRAPQGGSVSDERVRQQKQARFNPIRNLNPENLVRQIDGFNAGNLREFSLTMEAIERRDDVLQCVAPKRRKAVARRNVEVLIATGVDDTQKAEAEKHQAALKYFYENLESTNAVDQNERGGVSLLLRQMMDAVGKRYAVHEILWKFQDAPLALARDAGETAEAGETPALPGRVTAKLQFVPLQFFENRTGRLRFLETDFAVEGVTLDEGGWMVTVGDGIMEACAVAYMFKRLPMQDWLHYSAKHGMPGVHGKTDAEKGSEQWNNVRDAVATVAANFSCVTSLNEVIEKIDLSTTGELPYPSLVERMDRAMAALWRGADLSTLSAGSGEGTGASLQDDEKDLLEADDARIIEETLQRNLDAKVIEFIFGEGVKPLAYVTLAPSSADKDATSFQRDVIKAFLADGTVNDVIANLTDLKALTGSVGLPVNEEYEEPYLAVIQEGALVSGNLRRDQEGSIIGADLAEPMGTRSMTTSPQGGNEFGTQELRNGTGGKDSAAGGTPDVANEISTEGNKGNEEELLVQNSIADALGVRSTWLAPLRPYLRGLIAALQDPSKSDAELLQFLEKAHAQLPELFGDLDIRALADLLEGAMGSATVHGVRDALRHKQTLIEH